MRTRSASLPLRLAAEFTVIVIGVLVALAVDGVRQEWEEAGRAQDALADIAEEVMDQHYTFGRITMANMPDKVASLERLVAFLGDDGAQVQDTVLLLGDLAESIGRTRLWLRLDRYEALVASGDIRLLRGEGDVVGWMGGTLRGPDILLPQVEDLQGDWSRVAMEILPPGLPGDLTPLSGYNRGGAPLPYGPRLPASALGDMVPALRERRATLYPLAQAELNATLANFHVMERIRTDFDQLLHRLGDRLSEPLSDNFELGRTSTRPDDDTPFRSDSEVPRSELGVSYAEGTFTGTAELMAAEASGG